MGSDNNLLLDSTKGLRSVLQSLRHPQQQVQQQKKSILLLAALAILLFISVLHSTTTTTRPSNSFFYDSSSSFSGHNVRFVDERDDVSLSNECTAKLDALDRVSDAKRAARYRTAQAAKDAGMTVYDKFWKIDTPNDSTAEREQRNRKTMIFDLFEPEAVCLTEERFGGSSDERFVAFGDGPKFVCGVDYLREYYATKKQKQKENTENDNETKCLVYSVGSNNNILFEKAVTTHMDGLCEIHTFDPTLQTPFVGDAYSTFHPWGLGKDGEKVKVKKPTAMEFTTQSVERIMEELGHTGRTIDIFKIDCEGCEYEAMPPVFQAMAEGSLHIDQLLIEMHAHVSYDAMTDFFAAADRAGFRITHKERNGWGCGGFGCVEYAFVSPSFLRRATAAAIC